MPQIDRLRTGQDVLIGDDIGRHCVHSARAGMGIAGCDVGPVRVRCQKSLERLQKTLGECTDHASAADRFARWSRTTNAGANRDMLIALGDDENEKAELARKAFCKWWKPSRRHSLRRRLQRILRRSA